MKMNTKWFKPDFYISIGHGFLGIAPVRFVPYVTAYNVKWRDAEGISIRFWAPGVHGVRQFDVRFKFWLKAEPYHEDG